MKVQVLLSAYNGEKYIQEQIDSILNQSNVEVSLLIRNDGSTDDTRKILDSQSTQNIKCINDKNIGLVRSFVELINQADEAEYYAFSDQDDVWDNDKLCSAISMLEDYKNMPAVYSSNARLVDSKLQFIKCENKKPITSLGSALIKNYATGCTVVFNKQLMVCLKKSLEIDIPYHDWWVNLVALCNGGVSIFDETPHISYRQHDSNIVGSSKTILGKWKNRYLRFKTSKYNRDLMAKQLLIIYEQGMEQNAKEILQKLINYRKNKLSIIFDKNIRTQKIMDDLLFYVCVLSNKI